jgi:hypothetical protein
MFHVYFLVVLFLIQIHYLSTPLLQMLPSPQTLQLFSEPLLHSGRFFFVNYGADDLVARDFHLKPDAFPNAFRQGFPRDDPLPVLFAYCVMGELFLH